MTDETGENETVVELEFELSGDELPLAEASDEDEVVIEVESLFPRTDGTVLEYLTVGGVVSDRAVEVVETTSGIRSARLIVGSGNESLLEVVSASEIATVLADQGTIFTGITATGGVGRLTVEVPSHVDAGTTVDAILEQNPGAELIARRRTDRTAPLLTSTQLRSRMIEDLTDRQFRTLLTAHSAGYFEWPRGSTADEVADELDVATPTFSEHLRLAERKVFDRIFEGGDGLER